MKKSPKTLQLETLLQMKQEIFLDWLNKSSILSDFSPISSFSLLIDSRVFSKLINSLIFEENTNRDLDFLLNQWHKYQEIPMPLFLEHITAKEIIENDDIKLLLLEFLYNISFKNAKTNIKSNKTLKNPEKAIDSLKETLTKSLECSKLEKSFENSRKVLKSRENLNISQSTIGKLPYNKENQELSPINKRFPQQMPIEIEEPPIHLKKKVLNWLISIGLLRKDITELETKLPKICTNGVIYADLIERVHGKSSSLKGIIRKPKNKSQIIANFAKIFVYLRKFEKLNPRFLFKEKELLESNPYIFWNFLDDLYYFFNNKISPYDSRYIKSASKPQNPPKPQTSPLPPEKSPIKQDIFQRKVEEIPYESDLYYEKRDFSLKTPPKRDSYRSIHQDKQNLLNELRRPTKNSRALSFYSILTPEKSRRNSLDFITKSPPLKTRLFVSEETKNSMKNWLKELGFRGFLLEKEEKSMFLDPFRNGILLFTVLGLLGYEILGNINQRPCNIEEIRGNWKVSWGNLKRLGFEKSFSGYFADIDEFIRGDDSMIYEVLKIIRNSRLSGKIEENPGYSEEETQILEKTLINWLKELLFPNEITKESLYKGAKTGVLLCEIVKKVLKIEAICFKFPRNPGESLMNINKTLETLKKIEAKKIGQKFLWKSKEILVGDRNIILGLLEDIFRYFLEIPAREGENYFADGPISEEIWTNRRIHRKNILMNKDFNKENQEVLRISGGFQEKNDKMYSFLVNNTKKSILKEHN